MVPPWYPHSGDAAGRDAAFSAFFPARWCPREVSVPQHNLTRGPTASSIPAVLGGWMSPSHRRYPAKLIPKVSQGSGGSWD